MPDTESTAEQPRPAETRRRLPRPRMTARRRTAALLAWGAIVAVVGVVHLDRTVSDPWVIQGGRLESLRGSLEVLEDGGPPLLTKVTGPAASEDRYKPVSPGDDQGLFVYVPVLAHWLGEDDPLVMLRTLFIALFAVVILVYPLIFHRLFDSVPAGLLAAPGVLAGLVLVSESGDLYWISAWAALALLPPIMLIARRWPRAGMAWLVLIVLGASFATSIRNQAGLPILFAAALVLLWQPWRWWRRGAGIVALLAAYFAISGLGLSLVREYRDSQVDEQELATESTVHVFWHNAYIGLGFQPNDHAIKWNDTVAADAAERERPGVRYLSPEYEETLRGLYLDILTGEPAFVIEGTAEKAMVTLDRVRVPLAMLAVLVPLMLLFGKQRRLMRRYLLLTVPAVVIFLVPPLITLPIKSYEAGWIATVQLLRLLGLCWLVAIIQHEVIPWLRRRREAPGTGEVWAALGQRRVYIVGASAVTCWLLLAIFSVLGPRAEREFCEWQAAPPPAPAVCPLSRA